MDLWQQAKNSVPTCTRCTDWNNAGLSSRCPSCDSEILDKYDELIETKGKSNADTAHSH